MKSDQLSQSLSIGLNKKLAVALLLAVPALLVNGHHSAKAIVSGNTVTAQEQESKGLVIVGTPGGSCSGVLIANDWMLTAGHCVQPERLTIRNFTASLNGNASVADAAYLFGGFSDEIGPDLALVHLSTAFTINGSNSGFVNRLWTG